MDTNTAALFSDDATETATDPTGADATQGVRPLTAMWRRQVARIERLAQAQADLAEQADADWREHLCTTVGAGIVDQIDVSAQRKALRGRIVETLVSRAEADFAPLGAPLTVDRNRMERALAERANFRDVPQSGFGAERAAVREAALEGAFDPDAVWDWLKRTYGGKAGEDVALRALGGRLSAALSLSTTAPQVRRGCLVLSRRMHSEDRIRGGREYGHGCRDDLRAAREALAGVAVWAGDWATANALRARTDTSIDYARERIVSRQKIEMGAVTITTYNEKVEIAIAHPLAASFRVFVAKYVEQGDQA